MEGFTVSLALVDAIPVLLFGASMILVAGKFGHPLFIAGAVISTLAGCFKVAWKLILGLWKKDLRWLNKPFVPMQATGFLCMLISFVLGFGGIRWGAVLSGLVSLPAAGHPVCPVRLKKSTRNAKAFRVSDCRKSFTILRRRSLPLMREVANRSASDDLTEGENTGSLPQSCCLKSAIGQPPRQRGPSLQLCRRV